MSAAAPGTDALSRTVLHDRAGLAVTDYRCRTHAEDEQGEEYNVAHALVFVRSGAFRRRVGRHAMLADANRALFFTAGEPYHVAHPGGTGDDCTSLSLPVEWLVDAAERECPGSGVTPERPFPCEAAPVAPAVFLALHALRARLRSGAAPALEVAERALALSGALFAAGAGARNRGPARAGTAARERSRAEDVRALLAARLADPPSLAELARETGVSPYHLVRSFRRQTGQPVHAYLVRLRLRAAAQRLADGAGDLAAVALDAGFAHHSHFTNAFRREFGIAPRAFRAGARV